MKKKEKDESTHMRLTKTGHVSILEIVEQLERIGRMLEWQVRFAIANQPRFTAAVLKELPDISDILEEKGTWRRPNGQTRNTKSKA